MTAVHPDTGAAPAEREAGDSLFRRNLKSFASNRLAMASAGIVLVFVVMAVFAPLIAPQDPYETDLFRRLQPPAWQAGGEWGYLLGCDASDRDVP